MLQAVHEGFSRVDPSKIFVFKPHRSCASNFSLLISNKKGGISNDFLMIYAWIKKLNLDFSPVNTTENNTYKDNYVLLFLLFDLLSFKTLRILWIGVIEFSFLGQQTIETETPVLKSGSENFI